MVGTGQSYIPERGDLIWISLNPQAGHEQAGRRPAVVLSPAAYNGRSSLAICCPITQQIKGYPFEVALPDNATIRGVVLSDQVKSLDWKTRRAEFIEKADDATLSDVLDKVSLLLTA